MQPVEGCSGQGIKRAIEMLRDLQYAECPSPQESWDSMFGQLLTLPLSVWDDPVVREYYRETCQINPPLAEFVSPVIKALRTTDKVELFCLTRLVHLPVSTCYKVRELFPLNEKYDDNMELWCHVFYRRQPWAIWAARYADEVRWYVGDRVEVGTPGNTDPSPDFQEWRRASLSWRASDGTALTLVTGFDETGPVHILETAYEQPFAQPHAQPDVAAYLSSYTTEAMLHRLAVVDNKLYGLLVMELSWSGRYIQVAPHYLAEGAHIAQEVTKRREELSLLFEY